MPLYRGTIAKQYSGTAGAYAWNNVYTIAETSALEALNVLNAIQLKEQAVSYDPVSFTRGHVVNKADKHDNRSIAYSGSGNLSPTGLGGPLPLFCTVRVAFLNNAGKPEQKYLRLLANEANLTLGRWDGDFIDFIITNYAEPLVAQVQYVGPTGEAHVGSVVEEDVQNRQLGWHRRSRPGFRRGWVAV